MRERSRWATRGIGRLLVDEPGADGAVGWSIRWLCVHADGSGAAITVVWYRLDWSMVDENRAPDDRWDVKRHIDFVIFSDPGDIAGTETWRGRLDEFPFDLGPDSPEQADRWNRNGALRDLRDPVRFVPCFAWDGRKPITDLQ
ncbi:hypothetical protein [Nocardia wallacei]|uniref:hypothetical protein n=1 Tax=Nocardia wallacei TaxID=480035 RepID=UPI00245432EA|nr:hypothetical protein [Nocardia wallacei]